MEGIASIAYVTVGKATTDSLWINSNTAPLTTDAIIRQIVEHVVKTIAAEQTALCYKTAIDDDAHPTMEIEFRIVEGQRSILGNSNVTHHKDRRSRLNGGIACHVQLVPLLYIPAIAAQIDFLLHPTLQGE